MPPGPRRATGETDPPVIAEAVLGLPAELIADFKRIGLADPALAAPQAGSGGVGAHSDFATKAAVLCWHLVKNHPWPDGNKRCAFLATVEFVERLPARLVTTPQTVQSLMTQAASTVSGLTPVTLAYTPVDITKSVVEKGEAVSLRVLHDRSHGPPGTDLRRQARRGPGARGVGRDDNAVTAARRGGRASGGTIGPDGRCC